MPPTLLNNPNTEFLESLPPIIGGPINWELISPDNLIRLEASNYDLKIYMGENFLLWRERWLEARRVKRRLCHLPFYKAKEARSGDKIYLIMSESYLPQISKMTPFEDLNTPLG